MLSSNQLKQLSDDLQALRLSLEAQLNDTENASEPVELDQTRVGRLSRMDAMQMQQQHKAERERHRSQLRLILQAQAAIKAQHYGDCQACEEPIAFARLKARPEAPLCISCQTKLE